MKYCKDVGLDAKPASNFFNSDYDLLVEGKKVDVKVRCGKVPYRSGFCFNVQAGNISAAKDILAFYYFDETNVVMTFVGAITVAEFMCKATLKRKGEHEKNGFTYHCDTYTIADNSLLPIEIIVGKRSETPQNDTTMTPNDTTMTPLLAQKGVKVTPRWRQNDTTMTPLFGGK